MLTNIVCFTNFLMILTLVVAGLVCSTDGTFVEDDELLRFVDKHTRDKRYDDDPIEEDGGLSPTGPEQFIPSSYKALPFYYLAGLLGVTIIAMCCTCAYIQYRFNEDALYRFIIERINMRKAIRGLEQPIQSYGGGYDENAARFSANYLIEPIRRTGRLSKRTTGSRVSSPSHNSLESLRSSEYCSIYENPNFVYGDEDDVNHGYGVNQASNRTSVASDQPESSQSGSASVTGRLRNAYQNARRLHDSISAKIRQLMYKKESLEENEQLLIASLEQRSRNRPERVQRNKIRELMNKDKKRRSLSDLVSGRFASSTESISKLDNFVDYDDVDRENSLINGSEMTPPGDGNDRLLLHRSGSRTKSKRHLSRSRSKSKSLRKSHSKSKSHSRRTKHHHPHHSGSGRSRSKRNVPNGLDIVSVPIRKVDDYREEPPAKFNQLPPDMEPMNCDNSQSKQTMETLQAPPIEVMPVDPMENTPTQPLPPPPLPTPPPTPPTPPISQLQVGFPQTMLPNEQITIPVNNNNNNNNNNINNNGNFETEQ